MKHTNKIFGTMLLTAAIFTSCADMDPLEYAFEKPGSMEGMEYLADYGALKEYKTSDNVSPDFKLGMALSASDYNNDGLVTRLANANFEEVVAGNEMKMASIVNDNGAMDFSTVSSFVTNATGNNMSIYGHTLAWHSQQPVKWLNSLIADRPIEVDPDDMVEKEVYSHDFTVDTEYSMWGQFPETTTYSIDGGLKITTSETIPNFWELQYMVADGFSLEEGKRYILRTVIQGTPDGSLHFVVGAWGTDVSTGTLSFTGEEETIDIEFNGMDVSGVHVLFQSGDYAGTYTVKSATILVREAAGPSTYYVSLIDNGDMEGDDAKNFAKKENSGDIVYEITDGVGVDGSRGVKILSMGGQATEWESQFWIVSNEVLNEGDKVHVAFDYRADGGCVGTSVDTQAHFEPGEYQHYSMAGSPVFTADWQTYDRVVTIDASMAGANGMKSIAFNMSPNTEDGAYYIDNVVFEIEKAGDGIPLTPEEKRDTLTWAMEQWIAGMMDACDGNVKAWDVVNEAISGGNPDSEGVYALQHGTEGGTDFFWQDHMGDLDYVRTAVRLAREYGPEDIKLFINDYNLESDWDQNGKLKSLIKWIERWEADGVTKIDGIGTQMHLSCYTDETIQNRKKEHIVEMFKLMAATGKLVRVSELDIDFKDAEGNNVNATEMTQEQLHIVADFYKWIVQQYLANVPAQQQWGICIWTAIDAAPDVSWTHNQLYGLWDKNYNRTHSYAGFADGLAGK